MKPPRGLTESEAAAWARLAASVAPLRSRVANPVGAVTVAQPRAKGERDAIALAKPVASRPPRPTTAGSPPPEKAAPRAASPGLDSHWERRLRAGTLAPDFTLDLHEHSLDAAYQRLLGGLDIARETGARVVLVIAGKERPAPFADRAGQRGAIRSKLLDWLAASRHAPAIAAIRKAHRRHGGEGALYIVLRKPR